MQKGDKVRVKAGMGDYSHSVGEVCDIGYGGGGCIRVKFLTNTIKFKYGVFYTSDVEVVPQGTRFSIVA
jgi:hypothetical protein